MKRTLLILFVIAFSLISNATTEKTILEIKDGKEIFQSKSDWWDKYSGGIIAGVTVLASLGISVWQARVSQKYTKAIVISEARIRWINDLRPLLSKLISEISETVNLLKEIVPFIDKNKGEFKKDLTNEDKNELNDIAEKILENEANFSITSSQIKLFLNKDEENHNDLLNSISEYLENSKKEIIDKGFKNSLNSEDLIIKAQIVLKTAWEQAKNEG